MTELLPANDPNSSIKNGLHDYYFQEYRRLYEMSLKEPDQAFFHFAMGSMLVNLDNIPLAIRQYRLFLKKSVKEERKYGGYKDFVEGYIKKLEEGSNEPNK